MSARVNNRLYRFILCFVAALASAPLWANTQFSQMDLSWVASGLFNPSGGDVSVALLEIVFGSVGQALGGASNVTSDIFRVFNIGVMAVAGGFISYTIMSNVVRTAQDAGGAGRKFNFKMLVRVVSGMSLMTPGITGYSLIQVLVMHAIVFGVGLADTVWMQALDYLKTSSGTVYSTPTSQGYDTIAVLLNSAKPGLSYSPASNRISQGDLTNTGDIALSAYCLQMMEAYQQVQNASSDTEDDEADTDYAVRFGSNCNASSSYGDRVVCFGSSSYRQLCGAYYWSGASVDESAGDDAIALAEAYDLSALSAISNYIDELMAMASNEVITVYGQIQNGVSEDSINIRCASADYDSCSEATSLLSAASSLYQNLSAMELVAESDNYAWVEEAKEAGWAAAGNYYYQMIGQTGATSSPLLSYGGDVNISDYQLYALTTPSTADGLLSGGKLDSEAHRALSILITALGSQLGAAYSQLIGQSQSSGQLSDLDETSYQSAMSMDLMGQILNYILGVFAHKYDDTSKTYTFNIGHRLSLSDTSDRETMSNVFYSGYEIGVPQNNVVAMLADVISGFFGVQLFNSQADQNDLYMVGLYDDGLGGATDPDDTDSIQLETYVWWDMSVGCQAALEVCNPNWDGSGGSAASNAECYQAGVSNYCIIPGVGLLGAYSVFQESVSGSDGFIFLDALGVIGRIGKTLMRGGSNYFRTTIQGTLNRAWLMVELIQKQIYGTAVAGGLLSAGAAMIPNFGGAISSGVAAVTNLLNALASFTFQWDLSALYYWLPLGATLATMCLALGVLVALFVPLLPWMVFMFSVLGWVIAVIEAMVAAPIIALGVTHPEGHDLLGRSQQSLALLLGVFIRPLAILFGFVAAIGLLYIAYQLLNFGYLHAMRTFYSDIDEQTFMIFAMTMLGWITSYCYMAMTLVMEVFSMIFKIPDMLIRWVGGQPDVSQVRGVMSRLRGSLKKGADKGAEGAGKTASQGAQIKSGKNHQVQGQKGKASDKESKAGSDK